MTLKYKNNKILLKNCVSFKDRLFGFMFKKNINYALLFRKCKSVHTFFMRQKIDIIMTDKNNKIIFFKHNVSKNKVLYKKRSYNIYETPNNYFDNLENGDYLEIV